MNRHPIPPALLLMAAFTLAAFSTASLAQPSSAPTGAHEDSARRVDPYEFADGYSVVRTITLRSVSEGIRLRWPRRIAEPWDTALLAVRSLGAGADPYVDISAGAATVRQHLDPHAIGVRWLNLGVLRAQLAAETDVLILAHGVNLAGDKAALRLFDNQLDLQNRILVIAPHPDDAEIAAFGLYANRQATILTVTAGNAGDMNYRAQVGDPARHYLLKGYLRAVDSVTVPWQGGIPPQRTANLGYFDARLEEMYASPDKVIPELYGSNTDLEPYRRVNLSRLVAAGPRTNNWQHLVEDLAAALSKVNPQLVVMPDPRLDAHTDHEFTAVAVMQAMQIWKGSPRFLLYTNHTDNNHYPYGPAGTTVSLPVVESRIRLQRVYSLSTSDEIQVRKLFALESMHDLRLSPQEQIDCGNADAARRPDYPRTPAEDYFRRAVRANELFFAFDAEGARTVISDFLTSRSATLGAAGR